MNYFKTKKSSMNWFWWKVFWIYKTFPMIYNWVYHRDCKKADKQLKKLRSKGILKGDE